MDIDHLYLQKPVNTIVCGDFLKPLSIRTLSWCRRRPLAVETTRVFKVEWRRGKIAR